MGLKEALEKLRAHDEASGRGPKTAEEQSQEEEEELRKILKREQEEEFRRNPSLTSIPRFFTGSKRPRFGSFTEEPLQPKVHREARQRLLHRKTLELLDEEDLHKMLTLLKENVTEKQNDLDAISYDGFQKVGRELPEHFQPFFRPSSFLKFTRDQFGCIAIVPFFSYVVRHANIKQTRVQLSYYDTVGGGYLREKDMENFIFELIPTLPQLSSLQEEFYPFYVFTAVRKFFFFLDPKRSGRIYIRDLLSSPILPELYELRQDQPLEDSEASSNWFSVQSALKVYGMYLELDGDQNGMLSKAELGRYGSGMLTDVFVQRAFEEYQTYRDEQTGEQEMDYKTFLDFVLAMENKGTRQAIQYLWKLIDIFHRGAIDGFVINYFFRAVVRVLEAKDVKDVASVDDVKDEVFDMVKPKDPKCITCKDLIDCRVGGTVLSMLIDAAAFWRYDNRESLMMEHQDDDGDDVGF